MVLSAAGLLVMWWRIRNLGLKGAQERAKDQALLASLGEGIVVTDKHGNVELINPAAETLVGWKEAEAVGKKWYELAPLEDEKGNRIPPEHRATQVVLSTGKPRANASYYYVRRDGTRFAVGTTAAPVIVGGKTLGVIAVFRDISHEREVDQAKSEFVSLASHQLRTPLSAIKWFAEMLLSGDVGQLAPEQLEYVQNISTSNERMITLVNSLLNISRIESGRIIIDPQPTDLRKLIAEVVAGLQAKLKEKAINIAVSVLPTLPEISLDPRMIARLKSQASSFNSVIPCSRDLPEGPITSLSTRDGAIWLQLREYIFCQAVLLVLQDQVSISV